MEFDTDKDAFKYLQEHVPAEEEEKNVDISSLMEPLYDMPDELKEGDYKFEGKNGIKVSFKLVKSDNSFSFCYGDLRHAGLEGEWQPIFAVIDLTISTQDFTYSKKYPSNGYANSIYWLPNLRVNHPELEGEFVNIGRKKVYRLGKYGLSRPIDLLGFFHEIGHIATAPDLPHNSHTMTYSDLTGPLPMTLKRSAYELQREEAANQWLIHNTSQLFGDLDVPEELIRDYCNHVQLKTYNEVNRKRLKRFLEKIDKN